MFKFRQVAYMLLSRHFYVGIGVGFFLAGLFTFGTLASAFFYDNTDATDAHTTEGLSGSAGREYWIRSNVQATSTKFNMYSNWSDSPGNFWHLKRLVLTTPLASSTQVTYNYSVVRRTGSCHASGGFASGYGFTTASPPDVFTIFTSSSSTASYTLTTSTTTPSVWYGVRSRNGQGADCDFFFTSIMANGVNLLTISNTASSTGGSATTTVFYPLGLNAIIDDMNCVNTASGTDCTFVYGNPPLSIDQIGWLVVIFAITFGAGFYFTRRLMYHG